MNWQNADEIFLVIGIVSVFFGYLTHKFIAQPQEFTPSNDIKTFIFLTSSIAFLTPLL
jgi:hypothetical protein